MLYYWHKSFGLSFCYLLFFRIGWVVLFPETRSEFTSRWQRYMARTNHFCLYALMIAVPLSGFIFTMADGEEVPFFSVFTMVPGEAIYHEDVGFYGKEVHIWLINASYVFLVLHALGAMLYAAWLLWCNLNDESARLAELIPGAVEVKGSDSTEKH